MKNLLRIALLLTSLSNVLSAWDLEVGVICQVTGGRLSLRERPEISAPRIMVMEDKTELLLLERTSYAVTLDVGEEKPLTAPWYRVKTPSGQEGWCFGGYLYTPQPLSLAGSWAGWIGDDHIPVRAEFDIQGKERTIVHVNLRDDEPTEHIAVRTMGSGYPYVVNLDSGSLSFQKLQNPEMTKMLLYYTRKGSPPGTPLEKGVLIRETWWQKNSRYSPWTGGSLHDAVASGDLEALKKGIAQGTDLNLRKGEREKTALHLAVGSRNSEMIRILLDAGADPNIRDWDGFSPFGQYVYNRPRLEIIEHFLTHGANPNLPSGGLDQETPFIYSVMRRLGSHGSDKASLAELELFLKYGADPNTETLEYWLPRLLIDRDDPELMLLLIQYGLTSDSRGAGTTVGAYCTEHGSEAMKELLFMKE